ncbi:hypothetical protein A0256_19375 [Mucilaginibacter sp. PAMC 26640]|nr:hypothetical protein A0256_19375 [Mucilaginibacter sp. PAMC 26640]
MKVTFLVDNKADFPLAQKPSNLYFRPVMYTDNISAPVQANLVSIVSKYILLEESRKNLKGRCPFHKDNSTSLMVSDKKNFFKCFGCGKEGGPVEFMMLIENKSREDAITMITKSGGSFGS